MALPRAIDFSDLTFEQVFNSDTKQYRLLNTIPDDQWNNYCNKMLGKGISVTYDANSDSFTASPQKLKVKEAQMKESKKVLFEHGDKIRFSNKEGDIITGTIQDINESNDIELLLPDGSTTIYLAEEVMKGQKLHGANKWFKTYLTEDEKRSLLFDKDTDEEDEDSMEVDGELESSEEDSPEIDFDAEADELTGEIDEPEQEKTVVDDTMNSLETKGMSAPNVVSLDDLEKMLNKILGRSTSQQTPEQYPNGEAKEVKETVPALGQGPQPNILDTEFDDSELNGDEAMLKTVYGQNDGEILDKEFDVNKDKIGVVKSKIGEPSYNASLGGEPTDGKLQGNVVDIEGSFDDAGSEYDAMSDRSDGYGTDEYLLDDSDFERNAVLSGGVDSYMNADETGDVFEEDGEPDVLPSMSGGPELPDSHPLDGVLDRGSESVPADLSSTSPGIEVNKTVQCAGIPVQIVLTGVMLTMSEATSIVEGVKKSGLKVKKIESAKSTELNIIVEAYGKKYKIHYEDVAKGRNKIPFSIKHEKFQSLSEACERINEVNKKDLKEKKNFGLFNDKDILSRQITNTKDTTLLKEFENITYVSSWNVKAMGSVNLKTGLNEAYANIITHSKEANTLIKTNNGQFYLMKGNLKERSKVGLKKELVDLEGKKSYGIGTIVGIYENSAKGLGQVMYKTKRTSLPLLIWK